MTNDPKADIDIEAFKQFEHEGWEEVGGRYHEVFLPLTSQAARPLLDAAAVEKGKAVLDVACGPGRIAAEARSRGAQATGVDFSATMIAEAQRLNPGIEFREGDAEALPFPDESFDAVIIGFGLLHFAEPERAIAEAFRVLKKGGRIAFSVWESPDRSASFGLIMKSIERHGRPKVPMPPGPSFFRFSDHAECRAVLEAAGFTSPRAAMLPLRWRLASADALIDAFLESGVRTRALLRGQTPEALRAIRTAVQAGAKDYAREGRIELPTPCVIASAIKP